MKAKENLDALHAAIERQDLMAVNALMAKGVAPQIRSLFIAIANGSDLILQSLIKSNIALDQLEPYWKQTPIARAIECRNKAAAEILLKAGASPDKAGRFGPPLFTAIRKNFIEGVQLLVSAGADLEIAVPPAKMTPLMSAAHMGYTHTLKLLLDAGANPSARDIFGRTAYEIAIEEGENGAAKLLATVETTSRPLPDWRPIDKLVNAISRQDARIVDACLARAVPINKRDTSGWTPLERAVDLGGEEIVRKLLEAGANVNSHKDGVSPLGIAVNKQRKKIVELLLQAGAHPKQVGKRGTDPFWLVCSVGDLKLAKLFLAAGASPNARNLAGETCLMAASAAASVELVEQLLRSGAKVNETDVSDQTALFYAARAGSQIMNSELKFGNGAKLLTGGGAAFGMIDGRATKIINILLRYGANLTQLDRDGRSALTFAATPATAELLLKRGASVAAKDKDGHDVDFWLRTNGLQRCGPSVKWVTPTKWSGDFWQG